MSRTNIRIIKQTESKSLLAQCDLWTQFRHCWCFFIRDKVPKTACSCKNAVSSLTQGPHTHTYTLLNVFVYLLLMLMICVWKNCQSIFSAYDLTILYAEAKWFSGDINIKNTFDSPPTLSHHISRDTFMFVICSFPSLPLRVFLFRKLKSSFWKLQTIFKTFY